MNYKRALALQTLFFFFIVAIAIPAKKGIKKTITLPDGSTVEAELKGDEFLSFWQTEKGLCYIKNPENGIYSIVDITLLNKQTQLIRQETNHSRYQRMKEAKRKAAIGGEHTLYIGKKKGIIILVAYKDKKFGFGHNQKYYDRIANEIGFTNSMGFVGSVKDYFLAQSNGQFELDFDVVGPYTLSENCAYYGAHTSSGANDSRAGSMIQEACQLADSDVNFSDYDWDGDGEVDQVYVLFAGLGEAAGGDDDTIWPHESQLSASNVGKRYNTQDGVQVNRYACGPELTMVYNGIKYVSRIDGIGTLCHEFSHCLGLPDMYDTNYGGNYGMGTWDLLDQGSYNGNSFCPPNYTAYEKIYAGWITPKILFEATTIRGMKAQDQSYGQVFMITNDDHKDEYYLLENRQNNIGIWDQSIAGSGLMITHIDYNSDIWEWNNVNTIVNYSGQYGEQYAYLDNDHQRCTIYHADNSTRYEAYDLYPYGANNSLTNTSEPAAMCYNGNSLLNKPITNIIQNTDGTIDFDFMGGSDTNVITTIQSIVVEIPSSPSNAWYSINGQRLNAEPTQRGIYIHNGKKVAK